MRCQFVALGAGTKARGVHHKRGLTQTCFIRLLGDKRPKGGATNNALYTLMDAIIASKHTHARLKFLLARCVICDRGCTVAEGRFVDSR